jgi:hypothetical protein
MTDNPPVVDNTGDGVNPGQSAAPLPIPELPDADPGDHPPAVTDEDRQQYGRLLDSAMERGLLSPYEYETRLSDLAEAPTLDELKRIVTELPIFGTAATPASKPARPSRFGGPPGSGPSDGLPLTPGTTRGLARSAAKSQRSRWTKLIVLLVVVIVVFVALSIYAEHLVHNHNNPSSSAVWVAPPAPLAPPAPTGAPNGARTLRP